MDKKHAFIFCVVATTAHGAVFSIVHNLSILHALGIVAIGFGMGIGFGIITLALLFAAQRLALLPGRIRSALHLRQ